MEDYSVFIGADFQLELLFRIFMAGLCGAVVGYERKRRQKEAGIRTHFIVALGAAIFAVVSKYGFFDVVNLEGISLDASRVSASIVTGVCFLGAGTIFVRSKTITGLTTAAGIWAVSAIGLAWGSGMYMVAGISTAFIVFLQVVLHTPLQKIEGSPLHEYTCVICDYENSMEEFTKKLRSIDPGMYYSLISKNNDGTMTVKFCIRTGENAPMRDIYRFMQETPCIKSISH